MTKQDIKAVIVDDSTTTKQCDGYCGLDWSSAKTVRQAGRQIKARFGDRVQLEYVDLSKAGEKTLELPPKVRRHGLSLPLLLINGETRISGQFDIRMLLDAIEAEIEIKR